MHARGTHAELVFDAFCARARATDVSLLFFVGARVYCCRENNYLSQRLCTKLLTSMSAFEL